MTTVQDSLYSIKRLSKYIFSLLVLFFLLLGNESSAETVCPDQYPGKASQGFIVIGIDEYSSCSQNRRYTIIKATNSSYTNVCDVSSYPSDYLITRRGRHTNCSAFGEGATFDINKITSTTLPMDVCDGQTVPAGWVVTKREQHNNCYSGPGIGEGPRMTIRIPSGSYQDICNPSVVPSGWVVTKRGQTSDCYAGPGIGTGPMERIKPPANNMRVCDPSILPAGFVFSNFSASAYGCGYSGAGSGAGWTISQVKGTGPIRVCNTLEPNLPIGWVITERKKYTQCNGQVGAVIKVPSSSGTTRVCGNSPVPTGFVITKKLFDNRCAATSAGSKYAFDIRIPSITSRTFVCDGSVPAGWGFTGSNNYSDCLAGFGSALGYYIEPLATDGMVVCSVNGVVSTGPDMLVTKIGNYSQCPGGIGYTLNNPARDGSETAICSATSLNGGNKLVPDGFIISRYESTYSNCGSLQKGYTIKIPSNTVSSIACAGSPIPIGFAIHSINNYSVCSGGITDQGFQVKLLAAGGVDTVCEGSPIPDSYVITNIDNSFACDSVTGIAYTISIPSQINQTVACDLTRPIPEGFVTLSIENLAVCGAGGSTALGRIIGFPNPSGTTVICDTAIPLGYELVSNYSSRPECNGGSAIEIQPIGGAVIPVEFINKEPDVPAQAVNYICGDIPSYVGFLRGASTNQATCP